MRSVSAFRKTRKFSAASLTCIIASSAVIGLTEYRRERMMRGSSLSGSTGGVGLGATTLVAGERCLPVMIFPLTLSAWRRKRSTAWEAERYISVVSDLLVRA